MASIGDVKRRHEADLLRRKGVVGVGVGSRAGRECITILLKEKDPALERDLPKEIEGFPTVVEVVGDVRAWR